jgi:hypothetical protein
MEDKMRSIARRSLSGLVSVSLVSLCSCEQSSAPVRGVAAPLYSCDQSSAPPTITKGRAYTGITYYEWQRSKRAFEIVESLARLNPSFSPEFLVYRGTIDSIVEEESGGVKSALLAVQGGGMKLLKLGAGSYQVTEKVWFWTEKERLTGLFDPRGKPLLRTDCRPGDSVTAVCWKRDLPEGHSVPVRAFGNSRGVYMCSAELLRYMGQSRSPFY